MSLWQSNKKDFVRESDIDILIGPFEGELRARDIARVTLKLLEDIPWHYPIQIHALDDASKGFLLKLRK